MTELFADHHKLLEAESFAVVTGRVIEVTGLTVIAGGLSLPVGSMCRIERRHGSPIGAQVVGLRADRAILMPLKNPLGVAGGDRVRSTTAMQHVGVGRQLLGRVVNGLGQVIDVASDPRVGRRDGWPIASAVGDGRDGCPIASAVGDGSVDPHPPRLKPWGTRSAVGDGRPIAPPTVERHCPVYAAAPPALERGAIDQPLPTGIRSIDAMTTVGCGQRMGIFAGTGVGKSVLMGMIARNTAADVAVIALVGERGREVGEFIRKDLGEEGLKRAVLVISTSDESPVLRVRACFVAVAIAEYFRDEGADVLLMMDSLTRMAMAQRQIGLAVGEPPATKGYPPSVFSLMPQLLERAGKTSSGSLTGLFTVLVEGDDINEPISDAARGFLDGHVWLSRDLANRGHYPAVSVLESISRVMNDVVDKEHLDAAAQIRRLLAVWADIEDMVNIGAYAEGTNAEFDTVIRMKPKVDAFLRQDMGERTELDDSRSSLIALAEEARSVRKELNESREAAAV